MPTHLPHRAPGQAGSVETLAGIWLAGLLLLAAVAGATDGQASSCGGVTRSAMDGPRAGTDDATPTALRDMLTHD